MQCSFFVRLVCELKRNQQEKERETQSVNNWRAVLGAHGAVIRINVYYTCTTNTSATNRQSAAHTLNASCFI